MSRLLSAHSRLLLFIILLFFSAHFVQAGTTMPDLLGQSIDQAKQTLSSQNITITSIRQQKSNRPKGEVLIQSPKAGQTIHDNTPVRLIISEPLEQLQRTKVPNLKGLSLEAAKARLTEAQLKVGQIRKRKMEVEDEHVFYQTPLPNETRLVGSSVNITLAQPLPMKGPRVKVRFDKSRVSVGESMTLRAEVLNPLTDVKPRYSFNINGRVIPTESPSLTYQFEQPGKFIIIASARYGRQPWINSRSRSVYVGKDKVSEPQKTASPAPASVKQTETPDKQAELEKWINPKAGIYPKALSIKAGKMATFYSRSRATKRSGLVYQWRAAKQVGTERQFSIDTQRLQAGKTYTVQLRIKDDRGLVDVTKATLEVLAEQESVPTSTAVLAEDEGLVPDASVESKADEQEQASQDSSNDLVELDQKASDEKAVDDQESIASDEKAVDDQESKASDEKAVDDQQSLEPNDENASLNGNSETTETVTNPESEPDTVLEVESSTQAEPMTDVADRDKRSDNQLNQIDVQDDGQLTQPSLVQENAANANQNQQQAMPAETTASTPSDTISVHLKSSSLQLLSGSTVKFNVEPISAITRDDFELIIKKKDTDQRLRLTQPLINAEHSLLEPGSYTVVAKVMTAGGIVQTNSLTIRVYSLWIPVIIVLFGGSLALIHLRLKRNRRRRWD